MDLVLEQGDFSLGLGEVGLGMVELLLELCHFMIKSFQLVFKRHILLVEFRYLYLQLLTLLVGA